MGPLSLLRFLPTSAIGNMLNLPGQDLPFLPARFMANMVKQAVKPDYPDVPLPFRIMGAMPPQQVMGRMGTAVGLPDTGYPVPIRMIQGALNMLRGTQEPQLDDLSGGKKADSCSSRNPFSCFLGR